MADPILIAQHGDTQCFILPGLANRHGLITGATGTGKTVTLQKLAESFSAIGVPVFMSDVKGDLTGISQPGSIGGKLAGILQERGLPTPAPMACPTTLWDVFGEQGHPVRATVSDMGPLLLSRMLDLNETQAGVLNLVFKIADDNGLLLLDMKDLRAMLTYVGDNAKNFTTQYGNVSTASIGAIQRGLLTLESQGGDKFFGEPMLNLDDMMQTVSGKGVINILSADKLLQSPRLYATFLLWMLSDLYERLPEIGDPEKPKFAFFFDEAHLLFNDAPKVLLERIELVVRLIRSKGVGVYFVTQNPIDVPDTVLAQLGNRVQHALRAFTARDQKAVKATAETMRQPQPGHRNRHHRTGHRRGAGQLPRRERPARRDAARVRHPARQPDRPDYRRAARRPRQELAGGGHLRTDRGPRIGLRNAGPARGAGQRRRPGSARWCSARAAGRWPAGPGRQRGQGSHVRPHRPARRPVRRPGAERGQGRDAPHGPRAAARRARQPAGRQAAISLIGSQRLSPLRNQLPIQ